MPWVVLIALFLALGVAGCQSGGTSARPAATPAAPNVVIDSKAERVAWAARIRAVVMAGGYARADSIADALRASGETWPDGHRKLGTFYDEGFGDLGDHGSDEAWQAVIERLEDWRARRPESLTAPVALVSAYTGWAWFARGSGFARSVKKKDWQPFRKRLAMAHRVLDDTSVRATRCPHWYDVAMPVARGERWSRDSIETLYREGIAADPGNWRMHDDMAMSLMPRWYGEPGEWEQFALDVTRVQPAGDRDALYAEIVRSIGTMHANVFEETDASWFRVHRGYDELLRRHPGSVRLESEYAMLATMAGDRARARAAFERLAGKWDISVWRSGTYYWEAYRWAMPGGAAAGTSAG